MTFAKNVLVLMLTALPGLIATSAHAEDISIGGDIGVFSQYAPRGLTYTNGKPAVQGDIHADLDGLTASVWFSNAYASPAPQFSGRDVDEFDWSLDYSGSVHILGYSVGVVYYTYLYDSAANYVEAYAGLSYDALISPSLKTYVTANDSNNKATLRGDVWSDLLLSADLAGLTISAGASYAYWVTDAVNRSNTDLFKAGVQLVTLGLSKDVAMGDVTMTASLTGSIPVIGDSADGQKRIYGSVAKKEVVFGMNLAY